MGILTYNKRKIGKTKVLNIDFKAMHPTKTPMAGSEQLCIEKL